MSDAPRPMRVLVMWAHDGSPNLGVRVLASGTEAWVRRVWPNAEVTFSNYGARVAPVPLASWKALAREAITRKAGLADWYRSFDFAVDTRAGDSFASIYGMSRHVGMSAAFEAGHRAGLPMVLGPQTIGPFESSRSRLLARRSLRTARLVMARDSVSAGVAERLGRPVDVETTDVVFALPVETHEKSRDVILNVSGLLWDSTNSHVDGLAYRDTVRDLYRRLVGDGRTVSLLSHVLEADGPDTDLGAVRALASELGGDVEVLQPTSLSDARSMLAGAELVIGSRMHACLNALSVGTPAIALAYSRKFEPLLGALGWNHVIDLRSEANAAEVAAKLAGRAGLTEQVAEVLAHTNEQLNAAAGALAERFGAK